MDDRDPLNRLSPRMREVYDLDRQGLSPEEIGRRLLLSEFSVQMYLENIELRLAWDPRPPYDDEPQT
jgi:DNA-binding CsgD family transcriptional regulator